MKEMIIKWLGLDALTAEVETLHNQIKHLSDEVNALEERVQEKIDEIEEPDMSDYVREEDIKAEIAEQVKEAFDDLSEGDKLIDRIIEEYENVQAVRIERAVQKAIKAKAKPKKK